MSAEGPQPSRNSGHDGRVAEPPSDGQRRAVADCAAVPVGVGARAAVAVGAARERTDGCVARRSGPHSSGLMQTDGSGAAGSQAPQCETTTAASAATEEGGTSHAASSRPAASTQLSGVRERDGEDRLPGFVRDLKAPVGMMLVVRHLRQHVCGRKQGNRAGRLNIAQFQPFVVGNVASRTASAEKEAGHGPARHQGRVSDR
jgi:hypothetical protein